MRVMMRTMTPKGRQEPPSSKALFASKARIQAHVSRKREKQTLKPTQHAKPSRTMTQIVTQTVTMSDDGEMTGGGDNDNQTKLDESDHHHHHSHHRHREEEPSSRRRGT